MSIQLALWDDAHVVLSIRESRRARHLILQALPPRTVEVVVPRGMRAASVRDFVREHREWIDRAGAEMLAAYPDDDLKPALIDLQAIGKQFSVSYLRQAAGSRQLREWNGGLRLCGAGPADWQALLRRWLLARGREVLRPWLQREADRIGLAPRRVQIRLQKTRWGSCSARRSISLNAALLLIPSDLVRYLLVHELCHLQHLNHSRRYWQTVARHEPNYRELDRKLAASWRTLPAWVLALA